MVSILANRLFPDQPCALFSILFSPQKKKKKKTFLFKRVRAFLSPAKQCLIKIPGNVLHLMAVYGKILHCKLSVTAALSRKKQEKKKTLHVFLFVLFFYTCLQHPRFSLLCELCFLCMNSISFHKK